MHVNLFCLGASLFKIVTLIYLSVIVCVKQRSRFVLYFAMHEVAMVCLSNMQDVLDMSVSDEELRNVATGSERTHTKKRV